MARRKLSTPLSLSANIKVDQESKAEDLTANTSPTGQVMTDNLGHPVGDDQNSLRAGVRGPTLLEDFFFREKISHFDHERIPERIVHARGAGAHGYFRLDKSLSQYTTAKVLTEVGEKTPVFARFSTVAGSRGSADTPRDVRGFAIKFYTKEGNWDIVGNNIPVFFIQDAIKFPDLIHAVKPEPHREIPQAASAHDTFYDFISLTPEAMHMMMWLHSDRTLPRSLDRMDGFGVHTFRLINARGEAHLVKYHFKAALGAHSLVWDESQKIAGKDADFHRRHMYDTLDAGGTLEWDLGVQVFTEAQADRWDFDVLDPTKIVPEDLVPVQKIGRLVLDRSPDNFFAEVEQVAYMPTNIVPGMDFSSDPLLQGRTFSYLDTQLSRLGSPNWTEIPINRPVNPVRNNQRDGHMRQTINPGRVSYFPNALAANMPAPAGPRGFTSYPEQMRDTKRRARADSFSDHYGQAKLFWNSMSPVEREHITRSWAFELSMCEDRNIRLRMLAHLDKVNEVLSSQVAIALGEPPRAKKTAHPGGAQDSAEETALLASATSKTSASGKLQDTRGLSQLEGQPHSAKSRKVAILAAPGVNADQVAALMKSLKAAGATGEVVGTRLGKLDGAVEAKKTLSNTDPVLYDAVFIPGGARSVQALIARPEAHNFVVETYRHAKPIGSLDEGAELISASPIGKVLRALGGKDTDGNGQPRQPVTNLAQVAGVNWMADATAKLAGLGIIVPVGGGNQAALQGFLQAVAHHRFWGRPQA